MTTATLARPATQSSFARRSHYLTRSLVLLLRDWSFLAFIIAMPVTIYLLFAGIYGDQGTVGGAKVAATMMVTMATYGGLGAAMIAGAGISSERSSGWFRQLMLTPLTPAEFISSKVLTAVGAILPALIAVFVAGLVRGVRLPIGTWASILGLLLAALMPLVLLGLVIGLWFKQQTATAVTTLIMLAISIIGGLWVPLDMMPGWLQTIGRLLPSYWASQIGTWPIGGGSFPWQGAVVIAIWSAVLLALGALGYGRAVRSSRR